MCQNYSSSYPGLYLKNTCTQFAWLNTIILSFKYVHKSRQAALCMLNTFAQRDICIVYIVWSFLPVKSVACFLMETSSGFMVFAQAASCKSKQAGEKIATTEIRSVPMEISQVLVGTVIISHVNGMLWQVKVKGNYTGKHLLAKQIQGLQEAI